MKATRAAPGEQGAPSPLRQTLLLLERLHKQVSGALDHVLAQEQMSLAEWLIVSEVASTGEASLSRIATRLARDPGSLSRTITRLIQRELLDSTRNGYDRRCATLSLTQAGHAVHVRLARGIERIAWTGPTAATSTGQLLSLLQAPHGAAALPLPIGATRRRRPADAPATTAENDS
jgi:DNA-binding MarR family transcriptional regulator